MLDLIRMNAEEFYPDFPFDQHTADSALTDSLQKAAPTVFVAVEKDHILGFLAASIMEYWFTTGIYVSQDVLYVRPDKRGTRAAVKLIKKFIQWGDMLGAREHIFGTLTGFQPERTAKLFEHCGARRVGHYLKRVNHG